jgi:hypothetical protein
MENAQAQIEELRQEVALLRKRLAQSEARLLACLVQANTEILACQTEFAMFKDEVRKEMAKSAADRKKRHDIVVEGMNDLWNNSHALDSMITEIQQFLWPVVENLFPGLLTKYAAIGKRFKATGAFSEAKPK